jgi:hypothetical protein
MDESTQAAGFDLIAGGRIRMIGNNVPFRVKPRHHRTGFR